MLVQLPKGCQSLLSVQALDAAGNPVPLTGIALTWSLDNPAVATINASADGQTAVLAAVGSGGTANVTVTDAADGISGTLQATVVDKPATLSIVAGPATPIPAPALATPPAPAKDPPATPPVDAASTPATPVDAAVVAPPIGDVTPPAPPAT